MDTPTLDPTPSETLILLNALDSATDRLIASVKQLKGRRLDAASGLPAWSRRTIVAHLTQGAEATVRMLGEAPTGRIAFYPGGPEERRAFLAAADRLPASELLRRFVLACDELRDVAAQAPEGIWQLQVDEPRLGRLAVSRLLLLRLNEVEVHHTDLDVGYPPHRWTHSLVDIGLPLRIGWLRPHHRQREPGAHSVNGTWHLVRIDRQQAWTVTADGPDVTVAEGAVGGDPDATFAGEGWRLLSFLLGRDDLDRPRDSERFKRAFPGP